MSSLTLIAAVARNGVIGKGGGLPWKIPEDLAFFKRTTTGHAVIMGRRTFEEVGRPLPNRRNIVVSRRAGLTLPGCEVAASLEEAIAAARTTDPDPFVIGGAEIYRAALGLGVATRMLVTEIDRDVEGDTWFPEFDRAVWRETERRAGDTPGVTFVTYERDQG